MRIAFIVDSFPVISETFILRQITGLIDLGHEVDIYAENRPAKDATLHPEVLRYNLLARTVYVSDSIPKASIWELPIWPVTANYPDYDTGNPIFNSERIEAVSAKMIECLSKIPVLTFDVLDPEQYGVSAQSLSAFYRLNILFSQAKSYDIIHAHFGPVANIYRFAKELWKAPMIVTFHGYDFSFIPKQKGNNHYQSLFDIANVITVNSQYASQRLVELNCPREKISQLNVGVNVSEFPFQQRAVQPEHAVRLLTVGRLVEKKGIEFSIRAVAKVKEHFPSLKYDIIGDGPLRTSLSELIVQLGLEEMVILHGAKDGDFVRNKMSDAHVFILASVTASNGDQEGTPVSLMEAQASGIPVLSTFHSGISEIVLDKRSGFLLEERDVDTLADRLYYLLCHRQVWEEMGRRGRAHVEAYFDISKLNKQLVLLYEDTILRNSELTAE